MLTNFKIRFLAVASPAIVAIVLLSLFFVNCNRPSNSEDSVVAVFEDVSITLKELNDSYNQLPLEARYNYAQSSGTDGGSGKKLYLDDLIHQELILRAAKQENLEQSADFIREWERAQKQEIVRYFINQKIFKGINVEDDKIKQYYENNKSQFENKSLPEVKESIRNLLLSEVRSKALDSYKQDLLQNIKYSVNSDLVKLLLDKEIPENQKDQTLVRLPSDASGASAEISLEKAHQIFWEMPADLRSSFMEENKADHQTHLDNFIRELTVQQILWLQAKEEKISELPEVKTRLEAVHNNILVAQFIKSKIQNQVNITDSEIQTYYQAHPEEFKVPIQYHTRHILVKLPLGADEKAQSTAHQKITAAYERLKAGESFESVAKDLSEDGYSAERGGDIGFVYEGQMPLEYEKVALALNIGQCSEIVKSRFGYHIIRLEEKADAFLAPLEEAKDFIINKLTEQKSAELIQNIQKQLREKSGLKINEKVLNSIT